MKDRSLKILIVILVTMYIACNSEDKIEGYQSGEIIVVRLEIEDDIQFEKITLTTNHGTDSVLRSEIESRSVITLKCPQKGEGTFTICAYTNEDTLCSQEVYAEGGFRPRVKLKDSKFEVIEWF
jgi:hypothetical protein